MINNISGTCSTSTFFNVFVLIIPSQFLVDKLKVEVNDVYPDKLNKKERIGFCEIDLATLSEEPNEID